MTPTVSVVTPFYNTGEYLEECIKSVLAQTFEDFEYVLVDNHSTDDGREIAASYAKKDDRISLSSPPRFLSQCANFNFALAQIAETSAYCKMVLADDWLFPQCLAEMVSLADANPNVGLVSSYTLIDKAVWGGGLPVDQVVFSGQEVARAQLAGRVFPYGNQSTVMYRADVVRRATPEFFCEPSVFFDTDAALRILATSDFGFVHQVLSYLRIHPSSLTSSRKDYSPIAADSMIALRRHGSTFLDATELHVRLRAIENWFYEGLGRQRLREIFMSRDEYYWDYQQRCLAAAGLPLQQLRVWKGAARAVAVSVVTPADHRRRLWA
jgi:glycosyltransferase involved in cell wall biosynthesis